MERPLQKSLGSLVSNRIVMKLLFGRIVHKVNVHRLTELDFWYGVIISRQRPSRHFTQKNAAAWWVHTQVPLQGQGAELHWGLG